MKKAYLHIVSRMIAPFLGAVGTIMFIFLLQFLMRSLDKLVGKGLSIWVILELIVLNLAWMLVLAVPMGVLTSTLMVFGGMSAEHEITSFKAAGINPMKLMFPVIITGVFVAATMVWFNDGVLPDANYKAKTLFRDIRNKKPTFSIEPGVFSDMLSGYSILAKKTNPDTGDLFDVTIFDHSDPSKQQIITAKHGIFLNSADNRYLVMTLNDGEIHEMDNVLYKNYKKVKFHTQKVLFDATGFGFERSNENSYSRTNREMSVALMSTVVDSLNGLIGASSKRLKDRLAESLEISLSDHPLKTIKNRETRNRDFPFLQNTQEMFGSIRLGNKMLAPTPIINQPEKAQQKQAKLTKSVDSLSIVLSGLTTESKNWILSKAINDQVRLRNVISAEVISQTGLKEDINNFLVEIHKKYALPIACLVFVFVGVPLGIMSKKGGIGMGAGLSLAFFLIYWIFLLGGEKLADRNLISPAIAMWSANGVILVVGVWLMIKMVSEKPLFQISFIQQRLQRRLSNKKNNT